MKNILFPLLIFLCLNSCNSRLAKSSNVNKKGVSSISSNDVTDQVTSGVWGSISKAQRNILRGGLSGAAAGLVQVVTLMWLRTIINYQYRFGKPLLASIRELYAQGGFVRFYAGIEYAIIQGPLARFGAVAANDFGRNLIQNVPLSTFFGTVFASIWRFVLMPIDTCKTVLQVEGSSGFHRLQEDIFAGRLYVLYRGSIATFLANAMGHYPWFLVHNFLDGLIDVPESRLRALLRNSVIGFLSSAAADIVSNSMRVVKTYKQTSASSVDTKMSYANILKMVISDGGILSLFFRGLDSRILCNGLQSIVFTVVWKYLT